MNRSMPHAVKLTIAVFAIKILAALVSLPGLVWASLSSSQELSLLAAAASVAALAGLAVGKPIARWGAVTALTLVYASHCVSTFAELKSSLHPGSEAVGIALFEAALFFAFLTLWFTLCFGLSVKQFFQPSNSPGMHEATGA